MKNIPYFSIYLFNALYKDHNKNLKVELSLIKRIFRYGLKESMKIINS